MAEPGHSCQFLLKLYGFSLLHMDRNELSGKGRNGGVCTYIDDNANNTMLSTVDVLNQYIELLCISLERSTYIVVLKIPCGGQFLTACSAIDQCLYGMNIDRCLKFIMCLYGLHLYLRSTLLPCTALYPWVH